MDQPEYDAWRNSPNQDNLASVVKRYNGILNAELPKYYGNLPAGVMKSYGKGFIIDSLNSYNPQKGKLLNHIAFNLKRLNRINYGTSSVFRMSEELQMGVNNFKRAREDLTAKLHRDPTDEELSGELGWSVSKVGRLKKQVKKEVVSSSLEMAPAFVSMEDPILDYVYHDLEPDEKTIFQHRTGYRGADVMGVTALAKKIKSSPATVSNKAMKIAKILNKALGQK